MAKTNSKSPAAGFYASVTGRFFVNTLGQVFELLLDDQELDGPDEALVATLPRDAAPLEGRFILPSFVLRMGVRLELAVPAALCTADTADVLDELHWRAEAGGWAGVEGIDLSTLAALVGGGLVDRSGERARLGRRVVQVLSDLTLGLCGQPFAAATEVA